jgi:NAD(P)-dependent dehydrogenase (short-subunit alcohol dehydrogenase family)
MNERFDLTGRTVIVTGGGKGIGKVYTQEFAKAGARVVAADLDGAAAKAVAEALAAEGFATLGLATDIASEDSTKAMAQAALERFGAVDVLINNASLMSVLPRRSWLEIPVEEWDRVMAVNLRGMFLSCRAVFPAMKAQQRGKIVNISSSRMGRNTQPAALHDFESRRHRLYPRLGARGRRLRHHRERRHPRHDSERDAGRLFLGQLSRHAHRRSRNRTRAGPRRSRGRRDVSIVSCQRFHDRPDHQCRRRQGDALRHALVAYSFATYLRSSASNSSLCTRRCRSEKSMTRFVASPKCPRRRSSPSAACMPLSADCSATLA